MKNQPQQLPLPTGIKWATRRRIYTIPNKYTAVRHVIGYDPPWPLGTIIRYKDTGAMFRYCGILEGKQPWKQL